MCLFINQLFPMLIIKTSFNQRFKYRFFVVLEVLFYFPCKFHFDSQNLNSLHWIKASGIMTRKIIHFIKIIEDIMMPAFVTVVLYIAEGLSFFQETLDLQFLKNLYQQCLSMEFFLWQNQRDFANDFFFLSKM